MKNKRRVAAVFISIAVISVLVLVGTVYMRHQKLKSPTGLGINSVVTLKKDLVLVNQDGKDVRISELKGKVWAFAQFYASCPMCAKRNGQGLKALYQTFKDRPDFMIVCITVNPETDTSEHMKSYAESLGADTSNWWFLTGDAKKLKDYMEHEMKYDPIFKRTDSDEIAMKGSIAHNMSVAVFNRNLQMVGRRDLYNARLQGEEVYQKTEKELNEMIESLLQEK